MVARQLSSGRQTRSPCRRSETSATDGRTPLAIATTSSCGSGACNEVAPLLVLRLRSRRALRAHPSSAATRHYAPVMVSAADSIRLAVLIDGDNTTPTIIEPLLAEIAKYGSATIKRAYGDWTTPNLRGWKEAVNAHAIQPMQQFTYTTGKNSTDSALIIDAMDLLYTGNVDGFCLVSSDSDFTKLASRLREAGKTVYGFGEPRTPHSLVAACDKFVYLDVLRRADKPKEPSAEAVDSTAPTPRSTSELRRDAKLVKLLRDGIDAASDDDGWANLGGVGSYVAKQAPDFDSRNWGFAKLVDLVTALDLFEVERSDEQGVQVREKPKARLADTPATKRATKRPAAKETAAKEPVAKKSVAKKSVAKRAAAERAGTRRA